jgi:hypothetical protein
MSHVVLWLSVSYGDTSTSRQTFRKELTTDFLPRAGDYVQLAGADEGMLLPVQKLYWSERGVPQLDFPHVIVNPAITTPSRGYESFVFMEHEEFIHGLEKWGWYE